MISVIYGGKRAVFVLHRVRVFAQDGDRFWRLNETYIRGNTIKYLRVPDEVIDKVKDEARVARDGTI